VSTKRHGADNPNACDEVQGSRQIQLTGIALVVFYRNVPNLVHVLNHPFRGGQGWMKEINVVPCV